MKKNIASLLLCSLLCSSALAVDLTESLAAAYQNNPELQGAREDLKMQDEKIFEALSSFLPSIYYSASKKNTKQDTASSNGFFPNVKGGLSYVSETEKQDPWVGSKSKSSGFGFEQNLFNGGKGILGLKYAKFYVESARQDLVIAEQDVFIKTIDSYLKVLLHKKIVEICKNNVISFEKRYIAVEEKLAFGAAKKSELASASAALEDAKSTRTSAEAVLISSLAAFKQLTQLDTIDLSEVGTDLLGLMPKSEQEISRLALSNNPELKKANFQMKLAELGVKISIGDFLPVVSLRGSAGKNWSYTRNNTKGYNPYTNSKSIELEVKVPIYSKGMEYSKTRGSVAQSAKLKYSLKNTRNDINRRVIQIWAEHVSAHDSMKSSYEAMNAANVALEAKQQEYDEGVETLSELLKSQKDFFDYQQRYFENIRVYGLSRYKVIQMVGALNAKDLNLPTKIYSPTLNYDRVNFKLFGF